MKIDKNTAQEIEKYLDGRIEQEKSDSTEYVAGERRGAEKVLRLLGIHYMYMWGKNGGHYAVFHGEEAEA